MFDGKPLNMLYEENKMMAEHSGGSRDGYDEVSFPWVLRLSQSKKRI